MNDCWADPLSRAERRILREKLSRACKRLLNASYIVRLTPHGGSEAGINYRRSLHDASAEMVDLHLDVTERAEVPDGAR